MQKEKDEANKTCVYLNHHRMVEGVEAEEGITEIEQSNVIVTSEAATDAGVALSCSAALQVCLTAPHARRHVAGALDPWAQLLLLFVYAISLCADVSSNCHYQQHCLRCVQAPASHELQRSTRCRSAVSQHYIQRS